MAIIEKGQGVNVGETEIPDNDSSAIAISSSDGSALITVDTSDGSESITIGQQTKITGPGGTTGDAVPTGAGAPTLYLESGTGASSNRCTIMMNADGSSGSQVDMYVENDRKLLLQATASEQIIMAEDNLVLKTEATESARMTIGTSLIQAHAPLETIGAIATALTGTFTATQGSDAITAGSSTAFTTELHVGAAVKLVSDVAGGYEYFTVDGITSDTILSLDSNYLGSTRPTAGGGLRDSGELFAVKTGDSKTLLGMNETGALQLNSSTGDITNGNLSIGDATALDTVTTGKLNTIVGNAPNVYGLTTGHSNSFYGYQSGEALTTGVRNTMIGLGTGYGTAVGVNDNTYIGVNAGAQVRGSGNVAIGSGCLIASGSSANNVSIGQNTMAAFTGQDCVGIGKEALNASASSKATVVGYQALMFLTDATEHNTAIGYRAGLGLDDGEQCLFLGSTADTTDVDGDNQIAIGYGAVCDAPNTMVLGNAAVLLIRPGVNGTVELGNGSYEWDDVFTQTLTESSDARVKENIENTSLGLDFINRLRPVSYKLKDTPKEVKTVVHTDQNTYTNEEGEEVIETTTREEEVVVHPGSTHARKHEGLIAQEVKSVLDDIGIDAANFGGYVDANISGGADKLALRYREFIGPLIKSCQDLSAEVTALTARVAELEAGD